MTPVAVDNATCTSIVPREQGSLSQKAAASTEVGFCLQVSYSDQKSHSLELKMDHRSSLHLFHDSPSNIRLQASLSTKSSLSHIKRTLFFRPSLLWWCPIELSVRIEMFCNDVEASVAWAFEMLLLWGTEFFFFNFNCQMWLAAPILGSTTLYFQMPSLYWSLTVFYMHVSLSTSTKCLAPTMQNDQYGHQDDCLASGQYFYYALQNGFF